MKAAIYNCLTEQLTEIECAPKQVDMDDLREVRSVNDIYKLIKKKDWIALPYTPRRSPREDEKIVDEIAIRDDMESAARRFMRIRGAAPEYGFFVIDVDEAAPDVSIQEHRQLHKVRQHFEKIGVSYREHAVLIGRRTLLKNPHFPWNPWTVRDAAS